MGSRFEGRLTRLEKALAPKAPETPGWDDGIEAAWLWLFDHAGTGDPRPPEVSAALRRWHDHPANARAVQDLETCYGRKERGAA